ncbi:MAG: haloacid dehalogenase type II [Chloroflexota bacterium]|nr:haloacid dehalogenase type II [Chloroflexota bacterium]
MTELDFSRFDALTFDCYGTLIDWETGIARALRVALGKYASDVHDEELLTTFARHEAACEAGPYLHYRAVLARAAEGVASDLHAQLPPGAAAAFGDSVGNWPAFPDSTDALRRLHERFRLGVITNCDDDLFARSNGRLGIDFDWVVTAQQAGSYKPDTHNFEVAFERLGLPRDRILHVAQSLFHDHVPAKGLGLSTVWINRRHDRPGSGATPPAEATPDLELPDMASLADRAAA